MNIQDLATQIDASCRFCNPQEKDRILLEGKGFYVMASLGPIREGYLLLVSKKHFDCCGNIPDVYCEEFDSLYEQIRTILTKVYGHVISYEHGRAGSCLRVEGSKHCYHAHMHFVPVDIDMNRTVSDEYQPIPLSDLAAFRKNYKRDCQSYVFVHDSEMKMYVIDGVLESQYLRKIVAKKVGEEHSWDWVKHQNWPLIARGVEKLRTQFEEK